MIELFERLLADMQNPDVEVRKKAVEETATLEMDQAMQVFNLALNDPEPQVRICALFELENRGDADQLATILSFVHDEDSEVASCAAWSVPEALADRGNALLLRLAHDPEASIQSRYSAIWGLNEDLTNISELLPLLDNPYEDIQAIAVEKLGSMHAKEALPNLIPKLASPYPDVRLAAILAVTRAGDRPEADVILPFVHSTIDEERLMATDCLADLAPDILSGMKAELFEDPYPELVATLIYNLAHNDAITNEEIQHALNSPNNDIRKAGIGAVRILEKRDFIPQMRQMTTDESSRIRFHAWLTLGALQEMDAVPVLIETVRTSESNFRIYQSLKVLKNYNSLEVKIALKEALSLSNYRSTVRNATLNTLEKQIAEMTAQKAAGSGG